MNEHSTTHCPWCDHEIEWKDLDPPVIHNQLVLNVTCLSCTWGGCLVLDLIRVETTALKPLMPEDLRSETYE